MLGRKTLFMEIDDSSLSAWDMIQNVKYSEIALIVLFPFLEFLRPDGLTKVLWGIVPEIDTDKNTQLELGKDLFIKDFDAQLIKAKKNDTIKVESTLPENFPEKELTGKKAIFECKITAVKKSKEVKVDDEFAKNLGAKNLIDLRILSTMKKSAIIINTSRGGIINEQDLIWALTNKEIYGAGIDVYEQEPPNNDNPLFKLDNVILTPHIAGLTLECRKRMAIETCENILHYLGDRSKLNVANIINGKKIGLEI